MKLPTTAYALVDELLHIEAVRTASFFFIDDIELVRRAYLALFVNRELRQRRGPVRLFACDIDPETPEEPWLRSLTWFDQGAIKGDIQFIEGNSILLNGHRNLSKEPALVVLLPDGRAAHDPKLVQRHHAYVWYFAPTYLYLGINRYAPEEIRILTSRLAEARGLHRINYTR